MNLQTKIKIPHQKTSSINYHSKILLLGSCFSENISNKLAYYKFKNTNNPFGIFFHPIAIENIIERALNENLFTENDVAFRNSYWYSFEAHSLLNKSTKEETITKLNEALVSTKENLEDATHIFITLGTSWVYEHKTNNKIVANCHKIPQKEFKKILLPIEQIINSITNSIQLILKANSEAKIILTVSPVRHLKDGFIENTRSKAHLIAAIHHCIDSFQNIYYFPSYEVQMDELRDYRFYKEDMIHPNKTAINYIWNKFKNAWISEDAFAIMDKVEDIQKGLQHKPFDENSEAHILFLEKLNAKQEALKKQFSHIIF